MKINKQGMQGLGEILKDRNSRISQEEQKRKERAAQEDGVNIEVGTGKAVANLVDDVERAKRVAELKALNAEGKLKPVASEVLAEKTGSHIDEEIFYAQASGGEPFGSEG